MGHGVSVLGMLEEPMVVVCGMWKNIRAGAESFVGRCM